MYWPLRFFAVSVAADEANSLWLIQAENDLEKGIRNGNLIDTNVSSLLTFEIHWAGNNIEIAISFSPVATRHFNLDPNPTIQISVLRTNI